MQTVRDKGVFYDTLHERIRFQNNIRSANMPYMHFHVMYEIYILFEGSVRYLFPDKSYDLTGASFILINPYDVHKKIALSETYTTFLIEFTEADLLNLFTKEGTHEILSAFSDKSYGRIDSEAAKRLFELANVLPSQKDDPYYVAMAIAEILQLLSTQTPLEVQKPIADKSLDRQIFEYVSNHVDEDITLDSLSAALFMSKQTLSTKFKKDYNSTVMYYVNQIKLNYARSMLKYSEFSINTISKYCGFKNHTYFSKIFKDFFGQTPIQFRKEVLKDE